ncbi:hypothetical protein D3C80_1099300 [compost metagenome]
MAVNRHIAGRRFFQTVQQANQRTFSGAAIANNSVNLSLLNRQIDVINSGERHFPVVKNLRNIPENNHYFTYPLRI